METAFHIVNAVRPKQLVVLVNFANGREKKLRTHTPTLTHTTHLNAYTCDFITNSLESCNKNVLWSPPLERKTFTEAPFDLKVTKQTRNE